MNTAQAVVLIIVSAVAFAAALLVPRFRRGATGAVPVERIERALRRFGPGAAAIISAAVVWYTWGDLVPIAKVHDEVSYVLQAEIFARGRWTVPSPPIPEFFEQPHVMVVPAVASKYPPGHAMVLTPGALLGFPALMPLVLTAVTAALIFGLAMRVFNPWVGALSWILWITAPLVLRFQPSFFSELTTTTTILLSWWCLLSWRETRRLRWLLLVALCMGWCAITRPLTALAFALPIGILVIYDVSRLSRWRDLALAMLVGMLVVGILPLWSAKTTGNWRLTPIELYRRDYMAYDKIGFTVDTTPPRRGETPVLKTLNDYFLSAHKQQNVRRLPLTAYERVVAIAAAFFQGWRLPVMLFALAGFFALNGAMQFAMLSVLSTFLAHLTYAHYPPWTIYYVETAPAISALTAIGFWYVARRIVVDERGMRVATAFATVLVFAFGIVNWHHWRGDHHARAGFDRLFARELQKLPAKPAIVFIHYTPRSAQHISVVFNSPDLNAAPVWVVHSLGPRNAELRKLAPNRASFDFDEDQLVGVPLLR